MKYHFAPTTTSVPTKAYNTRRIHPLVGQQGVTLIELMVGIAIGLLVVAVAMGALIVSRGISGTVSEATSLQQQAAYAFRVIGQQIRQAGSMELNLNPSIALTPASGANPAMSPVAFDAPDPTGARPPFVRASSTLTGSTTPLSFTVGYQNYTEATVAASDTSLLRDCLGQNPALAASGSLSATPVLTSKFELDTTKNELACTDAGSSGKQAIIGNVTDMQVRYVEQAPGTTTLKYLPSSPLPSNWNNIYAIEVCLELTGTEPVSTPGATYKNCSGADTSYGDRLKMVFRNVYQIRSQGQV